MTTATQKHTGTVTFQLGLFTLTAQAVPVRVPNSSTKTALKQICPDCLPTAVAPKQLYRCDNGHEHTSGELRKARAEGKALIPLTEDEVAALKNAAAGPDYVDGVMEILVTDAAEFEAATLPDDTAYRIRPDAKNVKNYAVMLGMASDADTALFGWLKVGAGLPKPYRIKVWEGQVMIQSYIPPENVAERDEIAAEANDKLLTMAAMLVEQVKEPFNPALLADNRVQVLNDLLANKAGGNILQAVPAVVADDDDSLLAMLEATMAAKRVA